MIPRSFILWAAVVFWRAVLAIARLAEGAGLVVTAAALARLGGTACRETVRRWS